jgi:hypothetical protein
MQNAMASGPPFTIFACTIAAEGGPILAFLAGVGGGGDACAIDFVVDT